MLSIFLMKTGEVVGAVTARAVIQTFHLVGITLNTVIYHMLNAVMFFYFMILG